MHTTFNPYIASPDEKAILNRRHGITNITYRDKNMATHAIALSLYQRISEGKNCLVVSTDNESKEMLWTHLADLCLNSLAHELKINDAITKSEWRGIGEGIQTKSDVSIEKIMDASLKSELADRSIRKYFDQSDKESGFILSRILEKYMQLGIDDSLIILQERLQYSAIPFDLKTYQKILQVVTDYAPYYQSSYELVDEKQYSEILASYKNLIDNVYDASYALFTHKEECTNLRKRYLQKSTQIKALFTKEKYNTIADILEMVDIIEHKLIILRKKEEAWQKSKGVFSFFSKANSNIEQYKSQIQLDIHHIQDFFTNHRHPIDEVKVEFLSVSQNFALWKNQVIERVSIIESKIPQLTYEYIKSINKLNYIDAELDDLELALHTQIDQLNNAKILGVRLENNSISFLKQIESVENILKSIDKMTLHLENNISYYQWLQMLMEVDELSLKVIDALRQFPSKSWVEIFNRWFYHNVLYIHTHRNRHISEEDLLYANDLHQNYQQLATQLWKGSEETQIKEIYNWLKKHKKEYFKILFSTDASPSIYWRNTLQEIPEVIGRVFNILILDSDEIAQELHGPYQSIFYIHAISNNPDVLNIFDDIHTYISADTQDKIQTDLRLDGYYLRHGKPLIEIPISDRSNFAMRLGVNLSLITLKPRVFKLKNTSLIYFGQKFIAAKLMSELYPYGIKEIDTDDGIIPCLVSAWLTPEEAPIIIIENHLLDAENFDHYLWQLSILAQIRQCGGNIINIDLNTMWSEGISQIADTVLTKVKSVNISENELQKPIVFEF
jgi:hypothetical protein